MLVKFEHNLKLGKGLSNCYAFFLQLFDSMNSMTAETRRCNYLEIIYLNSFKLQLKRNHVQLITISPQWPECFLYLYIMVSL